MKTEELLKLAESTFDRCLVIMEEKNRDYSHDDLDALRNFKVTEFFKLTDQSTGVAVRLCDKWIRVCNLLHADATVAEEKIEDTINDMINYLVILKATIAEQRILRKA